MFVISKLLSAITQPMFWVGLWWLLALLLLSRWRKGAVIMLWVGLVCLFLLGFRAIPDTMLRELEQRYPVPSAVVVQQHGRGCHCFGWGYRTSGDFFSA